jgi:phosphoglycolate phosphatase-like HAD superfamily hydrolase
MIRLLIFDVDGTLAEKFRLRLLPGVAEFFRLLKDPGCDSVPRLAIATNQGGVGLRYWLENGKGGNPRGYPTVRSVEERMRRLVEQLGCPDIAVYTSFRYQDRSGAWSPIPPGAESDPRWRRDWRKPAPGMLLAAMQAAVVSPASVDPNATVTPDGTIDPDATLFVGDSDDDRAAAQAAGVRFLPAAEFFSCQWQSCREIVEFN